MRKTRRIARRRRLVSGQWSEIFVTNWTNNHRLDEQAQHQLRITRERQTLRSRSGVQRSPVRHATLFQSRLRFWFCSFGFADFVRFVSTSLWPDRSSGFGSANLVRTTATSPRSDARPTTEELAAQPDRVFRCSLPESGSDSTNANLAAQRERKPRQPRTNASGDRGRYIVA